MTNTLFLLPLLVYAPLLTDPADTGFTISYWCGPPAKFLAPERFDEIKQANFTLAFPPCGGMTVEQNRTMLDYCQKAGLKAVIHDSRMVHAITGDSKAKANLDAIVKDYADHPALYAYHIIDEPQAPAFPGLGEVVAYLKEKDPKHPGYINLNPTYARDFNALGVPTYEQYVRDFVRVVKPFVISYDHYHFTNKSPDRPDFFENLDTIRKVSVESNIPFWNIVLLTEHFDYRHLNENEIRYEAMQTLAYGAHGLLWFTYWSPQGAENPGMWKHAMINQDGSRDPHYDMVKKVNAEVLAFASAMAGATSTEVKQSRSPMPVFTLGHFTGADGKQMRFLANGDYKMPLTLPVTIPVPTAERFNLVTKQWEPAKIGNRKIILELPPAGVELLRW